MILKPCPFCGRKLDINNEDTVYPTGIYWRYSEEIGCHHYVSFNERLPDDNPCYKVTCPSIYGGCDAQVTGDSEQEAIDKWNRRVE